MNLGVLYEQQIATKGLWFCAIFIPWNYKSRLLVGFVSKQNSESAAGRKSLLSCNVNEPLDEQAIHTSAVQSPPLASAGVYFSFVKHTPYYGTLLAATYILTPYYGTLLSATSQGI
jgi:hypothetical protein